MDVENVSGFSLVVWMLGSMVISAIPIWLAARSVGVEHPTLLRSSVALLLGTSLAVASLHLGVLAALVLVPLSFLLTFKFVLGASLSEAFLLGVLSIIIAALFSKGLDVAFPGMSG